MAGDDLRNIALFASPAHEAEALRQRFGFQDLVDVVRLGFAYALVRETQPTERDPEWGQRTNNYNVQTVDGDDRMLSAVAETFHPDAVEEIGTYRVIENLMNRGVLLVAEDIKSGQVVSLSDLLGSSDA